MKKVILLFATSLIAVFFLTLIGTRTVYAEEIETVADVAVEESQEEISSEIVAEDIISEEIILENNEATDDEAETLLTFEKKENESETSDAEENESETLGLEEDELKLEDDIDGQESFELSGTENKKINYKPIKDGVDYSAIFDYEYYKNNYPELKAKYGDNPEQYLIHFINVGMSAGYRGNDAFDVTSYYNKYSDLRRAFGSNVKQYYLHYMQYGKKEGRQSTGVSELQNPLTSYNGVNYSAVYDFSYYVENNSDIKKAYLIQAIDCVDDAAVVRHLALYGVKEGRKSSEQFNVTSYYNANVDLRRAYGADVQQYYLHYINYGQKEKRQATNCPEMKNPEVVYQGINYSAIYDYNYYIEHNSDIKKAYWIPAIGNADDTAVVRHLALNGVTEGRQSSSWFDVKSYYNKYADLRSSYGNDVKSYYMHYINYGKKENRQAIGTESLDNIAVKYDGLDFSDVYDFFYYTANNSDIKKAYWNDKFGYANDALVIKHFALYGIFEGRQSSENFDIVSYVLCNNDLRDKYKDDLYAYVTDYKTSGKSKGLVATGNHDVPLFKKTINELSSEIMRTARKKLAAVGNSLQSAYRWATDIPYKVQASGQTAEAYANYAFSNNQGNCLGKASAFCYMARALGYDAHVVYGYVPLLAGGMGEHGWVEIYYDGAWRLCDPDFEYEAQRNGWMFWYGQSGTWRYTDYHRIN